MRVIVYIAAAILACGAAGQPHGVKDCGFNVVRAVGDGAAAAGAGLFVDCLLFGCIPVFAVIGAATRVVQQVDVDCAGAVFGGVNTDGVPHSTISWNHDSVGAARRGGRAYCARCFKGCELVLVFRHAAAGYSPLVGSGRVYWAQASDLPTAREIAISRCRRASGDACRLVLEAENAG